MSQLIENNTERTSKACKKKTKSKDLFIKIIGFLISNKNIFLITILFLLLFGFINSLDFSFKNVISNFGN